MTEMRIQKSRPAGYARATCPSWRPHCRKPSCQISRIQNSNYRTGPSSSSPFPVPSTQYPIPNSQSPLELETAKCPTPAYGTTFSGSLSGEFIVQLGFSMPATCISLWPTFFWDQHKFIVDCSELRKIGKAIVASFNLVLADMESMLGYWGKWKVSSYFLIFFFV